MYRALLLLLFTLSLAAMDKPSEADSQLSDQQKLYFQTLDRDVRTILLPTYLASARVQARDNRADQVAEMVNSTRMYKQLLKEQYAVDNSCKDAEFIDHMVVQLSAQPPSKKAVCLPNRICLTAFLNPELLRAEFSDDALKEKRLTEFRLLSQEEKDKSILQVMRFCPSASVIEGLLQGGAKYNARDDKSGYCLLRVALEMRLSTEERKRLLQLFKGIATLDYNCADKKGITPLMRAVSLKDAEAVDIILPHAAVNTTDHEYNTALAIAARVGDCASVSKILQKHANVYMCNPYRQSNNVFVQAVRAPDESTALVILDQLVRARNTQADITKIREFQYFLNLALVEAARKGRAQCVSFLIHLPMITFERLEEKPPFFNPHIPFPDDDESALTAALRCGYYDIALTLLKESPDTIKHPISVTMEMWQKALGHAVYLRGMSAKSAEIKKLQQLEEIIGYLLKTEISARANGICLSACYQAARLHDMEMLKKLIDHDKEKDPEIADRVLFLACQEADAQALSSILEHSHADVADMNGDTPLHKLVQIDDQKGLECVAILLNHDANLFKTNKWSQTIFHKVNNNNNQLVRSELIKTFAAQIGSCSLLKDLINGASTDTGDTPLHLASSLSDRIDTLQQLLGMGANVHIQNLKGETPLLVAAGHFNVQAVKLLLEAGADPNTKNHSGCGPLTKAAGARVELEEKIAAAKEITKMLIRAGASLNEFKDSMLRSAARRGNGELVNALLKLGADPSKGSSSFKNTALHQAAKKGQEEAIDVLIHYSDLDAQNSHGYTALELSCISDADYAVTEKLLLHQKS